ncbi:MAG TPA: hypothetical protein O0W97_04245 [Methanocorpusculum sp.]|nr:hypothetical protein [Methanocorpusculum sp.]
MESENLLPPLFLDSNVIVGHQLSPYHRISEPSDNIFQGKHPLWWSDKVRFECYGHGKYHGVCHTQCRAFIREILRIKYAIDKQTFSKEQVKQYKYLGKIVEKLLTEQNPTEEQLLIWLDLSLQSYRNNYNIKKAYILQRLTLHTRETDYPAITNRIKDLISEAHIERDDSDIEIWLDAHDLAVTRDIKDLIFVSDNSTHVTKAAHIICDCTKINKIQELKNYCTQH